MVRGALVTPRGHPNSRGGASVFRPALWGEGLGALRKGRGEKWARLPGAQELSEEEAGAWNLKCRFLG